MEFYKDKAMLIIAGGRNDNIKEIVLNDIWVLKLENMEYHQVIIQNEAQIIPRHSHVSALYGSKLCLFGGINEKMMLSLDCQEIELDPEKVAMRVKQEKQKLKQLEMEKKKILLASTRKESQL